MPVWFDFALGLSLLGTWLASGWPATLLAVFAAILLGAYFLLGLAVIHAISRHWNGRVWFLAGLYFLIFVMAWVIVPISLLGLLESRLNLRRVPAQPPKSDDDEENK
jgi:HAMP domain-containing protein